MRNLIDTSFDFYSDTPNGKDPDSYSHTLREYHKLLWSKSTPNGLRFDLTDTTPNIYLHHQSQLGEFFLSSDSIAHSYRHWKSMSHIINQISPNEIDLFFGVCSTIGAYIIFPSNKIDNKMTVNGSRGINPRIKDRFDLTLECIRRHYSNQDSPLSDTLEIYSDFFDLFKDFQGYVNFFLLQDLVNHDYSSINYYIPFVSFDNPALPNNVNEYLSYKNNVTDFILARNHRI